MGLRRALAAALPGQRRFHSISSFPLGGKVFATNRKPHAGFAGRLPARLTDRTARLESACPQPQRRPGCGAHRRADLRAGRAALGCPAADLLHLLQPALAPVRRAQSRGEREVLQRSPARLGAGAGERRAGSAAGNRLRPVAAVASLVGGLRRRHGGGQRRHLGHRAGRAQPQRAAPDHLREARRARAPPAASPCWAPLPPWAGRRWSASSLPGSGRGLAG